VPLSHEFSNFQRSAYSILDAALLAPRQQDDGVEHDEITLSVATGYVLFMKTIKIDCKQCLAPKASCDDCIVGFLLGTEPIPTLNAEEQAALAVFSRSRMVPPLRLVEVGDAPMRHAA